MTFRGFLALPFSILFAAIVIAILFAIFFGGIAVLAILTVVGFVRDLIAGDEAAYNALATLVGRR